MKMTKTKKSLLWNLYNAVDQLPKLIKKLWDRHKFNAYMKRVNNDSPYCIVPRIRAKKNIKTKSKTLMLPYHR